MKNNGDGEMKPGNQIIGKVVSLLLKRKSTILFFFFFFLEGTLDSHFHAISANILYFFLSSFRLNLNRITYHRLSH